MDRAAAIGDRVETARSHDRCDYLDPGLPGPASRTRRGATLSASLRGADPAKSFHLRDVRWSFPTRQTMKLVQLELPLPCAFGAGRISDGRRPAAPPAISKPLLVTDAAGRSSTSRDVRWRAGRAASGGPVLRRKPNPVEANLLAGVEAFAPAATTASWPSRRQGLDLASSSPSWPARTPGGDFRGRRRLGGRAPMPTPSRRSSPCRPPPEPVRIAAPGGDRRGNPTKRSSSPKMMPKVVIADPS